VACATLEALARTGKISPEQLRDAAKKLHTTGAACGCGPPLRSHRS
jgi:hypothetical protein